MKKHFYHYTFLNLILYGFLLVATPFIMLQNYLQSTISWLSRLSFPVFGFSIPAVFALVFLVFVVWFVVKIRNISGKQYLGAFLILLMISWGHFRSDFYLNMYFYDLQQNWHYIAYGLFSFVLFQYLQHRNITLHKIILVIPFVSFLLSTFDESFQLLLSERTFDISDIAKDVWGSVMGIVFIYFIYLKNNLFFPYKALHKYFSDYKKSHLSILIFWIISSGLFLFLSSLLSQHKYIIHVFVFTLLIITLLLFIIHFAQKKLFRIIYIIILSGVLSFLLINKIKNNNQAFTYNVAGVSIFEGQIIPYFDFIVFPDKSIKWVDKKQAFTRHDIETLFTYNPDIIVIGRGTKGSGGQGFINDNEVHYIFDPKHEKMVQIINLKTPDACATYNRLYFEKKNALIVIHNTN